MGIDCHSGSPHTTPAGPPTVTLEVDRRTGAAHPRYSSRASTPIGGDSPLVDYFRPSRRASWNSTQTGSESPLTWNHPSRRNKGVPKALSKLTKTPFTRLMIPDSEECLIQRRQPTQSARQDDFVARGGAFYSISESHSGAKFINDDAGLAAARTESDNPFPQWTHSSARLERLPHMQEVPGSSPGASTNKIN